MQYLAIDRKNDFVYFIRYAWDISHALEILKKETESKNLFDFSIEPLPFDNLFCSDIEIFDSLKHKFNENMTVKFIDYR